MNLLLIRRLADVALSVGYNGYITMDRDDLGHSGDVAECFLTYK